MQSQTEVFFSPGIMNILHVKGPQEPEPWSDTLEAFEPGDACIQGTNISLGITHGGWTRMSEDCLHVNIYSKQVSLWGKLVLLYFSKKKKMCSILTFSGQILKILLIISFNKGKKIKPFGVSISYDVHQTRIF